MRVTRHAVRHRPRRHVPGLRAARSHEHPPEHHELPELRASVGARWTFLSDPGRVTQKALEIQGYTDPDHDPMIPQSLVLKPGLVIHSVDNGYWFWGRPSVKELRHDLRAVMRDVRRAWDLSAPGRRESWDAGDLAPFHGWDQPAQNAG